MGVGFNTPSILPHLIVSKAGSKLGVPTPNAAGRGRHGLRASPEPLRGLENCCPAEKESLFFGAVLPEASCHVLLMTKSLSGETCTAANIPHRMAQRCVGPNLLVQVQRGAARPCDHFREDRK